MTQVNKSNESYLLKFSAGISLFFAIAGIVVGTLMGSMVIIFDGTFSLISLLLTLLSLYASKQLQKTNSTLAKYGKKTVESVVIAIKATVMLGIIIISMYSSIITLSSGGRAVDASIAILFSIANVIGCGFAWCYLSDRNKEQNSKLIEAESSQWRMDTLLSFAIFSGFCVTWLMTFSPWHAYHVYADPIMILLISMSFIKVPVMMLKDSYIDLFEISSGEKC